MVKRLVSLEEKNSESKDLYLHAGILKGSPSASSRMPFESCNMNRTKRQINLLRGWPSPSLLPPEMLAEEARRVLIGGSSALHSGLASGSLEYDDLNLASQALLYGPDPGHLPLRRALSTWLAGFYRPSNRKAYPGRSQYDISFNRITITGGASQSLSVILTAITDPSYTRNIWVVAPGYFMAFKILEDAGFVGRLRAVPETSSGPDVSWLRQALKESEVDWAAEKKRSNEPDEPKYKPASNYPKTYRHVIYTVPTFANPSAVTTSLKVREELVRVARDFDALVVCDDVYDMLQWPADHETTSEVDGDTPAHIPRIVDVDRYLPGAALDGYGNVISNGTFSKICAPGVRSGWLEATEKLAHLISQDGGTKSGGAPSQMTSVFLCGMLERGDLTKHITKTLCPAYHERRSAMMLAIHEHLLPLGVEVVKSADPKTAGGYFIWLTLPDLLHNQAADVVKRCMDHGKLTVGGGRLFQIPGNDNIRFDNNIRLSFAWEAVSELTEGIRRLSQCLLIMMREQEEAAGTKRACR